MIGHVIPTDLTHTGMQQDRLVELQEAKSTDTERVQLKKRLLSVTSQRADIAEQYAVCAHSINNFTPR